VEVFGEPRRRLRNMDKAVIDYSGLRIKTHDLVCGRLVAGDAMAAVGDQLGLQKKGLATRSSLRHGAAFSSSAPDS
jgi:hypothetical protein